MKNQTSRVRSRALGEIEAMFPFIVPCHTVVMYQSSVKRPRFSLALKYLPLATYHGFVPYLASDCVCWEFRQEHGME